MRKIKEINFVSSFKISNDYLFLDSQKSLYLFYNDNLVYSIAIEEGYQLRDVKDNFCIFSDTNEPNIIIYKALQVFLELRNNSFLFYYNRKGIFYDKMIRKTVIFDFDMKVIEREISERLGNKIFFSVKFLIANTLFDNTKLTSYSFSKNTPLWHYSLPEGVYLQGTDYAPALSKGIEKILGVYDSILWIVNDVGHLIGLDIASGICKFHLKKPKNLSKKWEGWEVFVHATKSFIDTNNGVIFGLDNVHYWECDLNDPTETYLHFDISAINQKNDIIPDFLGNWKGDEIFFGQNSFAKDPSYVGIFNRQTKQITWTSRKLGEEGTFKGINKVEYQDNRLYVLDRTSTLHIFERESTNV